MASHTRNTQETQKTEHAFRIVGNLCTDPDQSIVNNLLKSKSYREMTPLQINN